MNWLATGEGAAVSTELAGDPGFWRYLLVGVELDVALDCACRAGLLRRLAIDEEVSTGSL